MATNLGFPKLSSRTCLPNRVIIFNTLKVNASSLNFPLASKIVVRNLSYSTPQSVLEKQFSCFGDIAEVKLIKDATKKSKGYAFIQYNSQDAALQALESMDHQYFGGRVIYVELAKPETHTYGPITSGPPKANNRIAGNSIAKDSKEKNSSLDKDEPVEASSS